MKAEIKGTTIPILEVALDQGEEVVSGHGELAWVTQHVQLRQDPDGGTGGIVVTHYDGPGMIVFAAKVPGQIVPVDIAPGQSFLVHQRGWLCGTSGITAAIGPRQAFRGGLWGGDGFVLERLGGQGRAWIELAGDLTVYDLPAGQTLKVHPGNVGMFDGSMQFTLTQAPGVANSLFGADGFPLLALTGPGRVWLQSMSLPLLAGALAPYLRQPDDAGAGQQPAGAGGAGGIVGQILGEMLGGGHQGST